MVPSRSRKKEKRKEAVDSIDEKAGENLRCDSPPSSPRKEKNGSSRRSFLVVPVPRR